MSSSTTRPKRTLPPPSWEGVRPIYKKLSTEFHVLTDPYGLHIDDQTKEYLDHLILAIDDIDDCIDNLPSKETRDHITDSMIDYLGNDEPKWNLGEVSETLKERIENLKFIVNERSIENSFIGAAETIFNMTEIKRHTTSDDDLIEFVKKKLLKRAS